jgi:multicomponent Na+:H+ antiporter subunit C
MEILLALTIGLLYAGGFYLILRRSLVKLIIGLILLGNAVNLLIFLMGGIVKGKPPIIPSSLKHFSEAAADPVPQALVLTAIVISFGLQAFAIILFKRVYKVVRTDDMDRLDVETTDSAA